MKEMQGMKTFMSVGYKSQILTPTLIIEIPVQKGVIAQSQSAAIF